MRGAEAGRLIVAVVVAAGAVALGESLSHGGHKSAASTVPTGQQTLTTGSPAHSGDPGRSSSSTSAGGSASGAVTVASSPAVERALRHGSLTVVIDEPPAGLLTEQNRSIAQGAAVAVDELNGAGGLSGGVRVKLVAQNLDGLSASALQSRLRSETAAVLILPCDTNSQLSIAAAASRFGMLMFAPCNPDAAAGSQYPTYWPVGMAATDEAAGLTGYMATVGYGRVFIVTSPGAQYVELLTNDFRAAAKTRGIEVAGSASIPSTTSDFSSLAREIEAVQPRPSAVFTALPPPFVNRLAASLHAQGLPQIVLGSTAMDTPLTLSSGSKSALENATFASYGFPRVSSSARRFAAEYRSRFRHEPVGSFPGLGFETIRLLETAVRKAHSAKPGAVQQALAGGLALSGVALADRAYQRGGDHNPLGEVAITKITAGSFEPLLATTPSAVATP